MGSCYQIVQNIQIINFRHKLSMWLQSQIAKERIKKKSHFLNIIIRN